MKLPELKGILVKVWPKEEVGDKKTVKQTVLLKMPGRVYDDGFGERKEGKDEFFEMDVINNKIEQGYLHDLIDKKVVVEQAFLNSFEYEDSVRKEKRYGKSIVLNKIREHKG